MSIKVMLANQDHYNGCLTAVLSWSQGYADSPPLREKLSMYKPCQRLWGCSPLYFLEQRPKSLIRRLSQFVTEISNTDVKPHQCHQREKLKFGYQLE